MLKIVCVGKIKEKYLTDAFSEYEKRISVFQKLKVVELKESNNNNRKLIDVINEELLFTYKKVGIVKYDAFNEMGGKLSFSMALLNNELDGFVLNAVHSREGCYTYVKEIIGGNSVLVLSEEEKKALNMAKGIENNAK